MRVPKLFHFSDRGDIEDFVPRAPERHPHHEPLVYAIDEGHSPAYLFPRQCPRIAIWTPDDTRLLIDASWETPWRGGNIFRYEFDPSGFEDCRDHGVWVNRSATKPRSVVLISNLVAANPVEVEVVPSLVGAARALYDFERMEFKCQWPVSMLRMANLPDWPGGVGRPVAPPK
jgi:hypothetical protein